MCVFITLLTGLNISLQDVIFQQNEGIECKIHDAASDCICLLLQYIKVKNADLFENVASLEGAYHLSVARESTEKYV